MIDSDIGSGGAAALILSATFTGTGANQDLSISGASAEDIVVVYVQPAFTVPTFSVVGGGTAWTVVEPWGTGLNDPYGYESRVASKVLNAADITTGTVRVNLESGYAGWIGVYRGATSISIVANAQSVETGDTLSFPASSYSADAAGLIFVMSDRDAGGGITPPSLPGLVERAEFVGTYFRIGASDFVSAQDYPGAVVTFSGFATSLYQWGHLLELVR